MGTPEIERTEVARKQFEAIMEKIDWGHGSDEPVVAQCDLENPGACEACD